MSYVGDSIFLDFASGKVLPDEVNKKGDKIMMRQKPYSEYAAKQTNAFKDIPPSWFAVSLSALYPFLAADKTTWETLKNTVAYPCTSLWPVKVVKRFIYFIDTLFSKHSKMFSSYQNMGGQIS